MLKNFSLCSLLLLFSAFTTMAFQSSERLEVEAPKIRVLTLEESTALQNKNTAEHLGLPIEEVNTFMDFQEAFSNYADQLYDLYPDRISFIRMEEIPARFGIIQFVGDAPQEAFQKMNLIEQLGGQVVLLEDGEFSYEQHVERSELSASVLNDLGYTNHVTFFDPIIEKIKLEINLDGSLKKAPSLDQVADQLQAKLNTISSKFGRNLGTVSAEDFELELVDYVAEDDGEYIGGLRISNASGGFCTAGFTIIKPGGTKGIVTAGHCGTVTRIESWSGNLSLQLKNDYYNNTNKRDIEWHTVNGHTAWKYFQSSSCCMTPNNGYQTTSGMTGQSICRYGKASNSQSCGHTVTKTGVSVTTSGITVNKVALTNTTTSTSGDSGGPWFKGGEAFGINKGRYGTQGMFTQIEAALSIIGADIYD